MSPAGNTDQAMVLVGLPESPIHDITLDNVTIRARKGVTEEHTKSITRANVKIELGTVTTAGKVTLEPRWFQ